MLFTILKWAYYILIDIRLAKSRNFFFSFGLKSLVNCFMTRIAVISVELLSDAFLLQRSSRFSQRGQHCSSTLLLPLWLPLFTSSLVFLLRLQFSYWLVIFAINITTFFWQAHNKWEIVILHKSGILTWLLKIKGLETQNSTSKNTSEELLNARFAKVFLFC